MSQLEYSPMLWKYVGISSSNHKVQVFIEGRSSWRSIPVCLLLSPRQFRFTDYIQIRLAMLPFLAIRGPFDTSASLYVQDTTIMRPSTLE
jgi:hypothetical protein